MKAQATAEFLLSFAIFLAVLAVIITGVGHMASAEGEFAGYVENRLVAERSASAMDSACLAPGLAGAAETEYFPTEKGIVSGQGEGAVAGMVSCGGEIDGEPI